MDNRSVPAKVALPQTGDSYPRTRLFKWLDRAGRRPLVWVMGPPGSGKTTLISDYLTRRHLTTLWYQADAGDADIATFFHYLGHAAHRAAPRVRRALPRFTPDRLDDLEHFAREFFGDLYARLKTPFAIVFDNYQDVPADAALHEIMQPAMERLPAGNHIIILSRQEPPSTLARARLNERMAILDDAALRLTLEEAQGIARQRLPGRRNIRPQVSILHELTHGWAAGLTLMLEQAGESLPTHAAMLKTPGVLFEYFASEVFAKADTDTRAVLLKSVFLPSMTVRNVAALTGERRAGRILNHLCRNNFFTNRYELPEPVFQYHPLFREFLLSRARRLPAAELTALRARAATLLEQDGSHEAALHLYAELDDWTGFERCLMQLAPGLLSQGRHQALEQWLMRLPADQMAGKPWMLHFHGLCKLQHSPASARTLLEQAHIRFRTAADPTGLLANWVAIIDSFIQQWSTFGPIRSWIDELARTPDSDPRRTVSPGDDQTTCAMFLALMYGQPEDATLPAWAERAEKVVRASSDLLLRAKVAPHLIIYLTWWVGDLPRTESLINHLRPVLGGRDVPPASRIAWHAMVAGFCWMNADIRACEQEVSTGLALADATHLHAWDMLLCAQGALATLFENYAAAEPYLARMDALHNPAREVDSAWYYSVQADRCFLQNDLPRARQYLDQALRNCREAAFVVGEAQCLNELARVTYHQGEHAAAQHQLQAARHFAQGLRNHQIEYLTWVTEAEFALLAGDEVACLQTLRRFLEIGRQQRYQNHHGWRGELMARLYARALEQGIETDYVLGQIRKRGLPPPEEARESDTWPFPYKIYTLGRFALVKDGRPLAFAGKTQSKPLELLKALIAHGGRQVNAVHLGELLWPDADGDAAHRAFDTTLHRLRRLLGHEQALILSDGKLSLNPAVCWVDAWAFERLMGRLDLLLKQPRADDGDRQTVAILATRLASIHRGPFLGSDQKDVVWAIAPRERLNNRLLRMLGALGRYWEMAKDWERAADAYHQAIDVHAQAEEYYQRLIKAYQVLQRPAEAAAVYQRCREILLATAGRPPSPVTEALYLELSVTD